MRLLFCSFLLNLLITLHYTSATLGGYYDFNGFRYQLANAAVDVDVLDFTGDDCPTAPCPTFQVPKTCNVSFQTTDLAAVATAKSWDTSYLASTDGMYPVTNWLLPPFGNPVIVDWTSNPGSVALTDSNWEARIVLRCSIPCPVGSVLNGTSCVQCPAGRWAPAGATTCYACTNGPAAGVYTSSGAGSSNCSYQCPARFYSQVPVSPYLLVGDSGSVRAVDANGAVTKIYSAPSASDPTYSFTFMLVPPSGQQTVFLGTYSVNRLNLTSRTYTTIAGLATTPYRGNADGTGTSASFNSIVGAVLYANASLLLVLDGSNCNLRRLTNPLTAGPAASTVTTVVGSTLGVCDIVDGTGTWARLRYPTDLAINPAQDTLFVADSGNNSTNRFPQQLLTHPLLFVLVRHAYVAQSIFDVRAGNHQMIN